MVGALAWEVWVAWEEWEVTKLDEKSKDSHVCALRCHLHLASKP